MTDFHATPTGNDSLLVSCPQTEGKCDTLSRIYKAGLVTNYGTFYSAGRCRVNGINTLGQTSASLQLEAGKKYFIMALQKEATNDDHLEVAWIYPGTSREIIPGDYLSPFYFPLSVPLIPDNYLSVHIYPNPASDNVTVSLSNQKGGTIEL